MFAEDVRSMSSYIYTVLPEGDTPFGPSQPGSPHGEISVHRDQASVSSLVMAALLA